jgi:hypothetical protein
MGVIRGARQKRFSDLLPVTGTQGFQNDLHPESGGDLSQCAESWIDMPGGEESPDSRGLGADRASKADLRPGLNYQLGEPVSP